MKSHKKTRVFLTGATGVMGFAGLKELASYPNYLITVLARDSKKNHNKLRPFIESGKCEVIWGDLLDVNSLKAGIQTADIVLHVGGMVSPEADKFPKKTRTVNVGSMQNIAAIVKELEDANPQRVIRTVYIGSVSQYGDRLPPNHWGSVGDPQIPAIQDAYAESKIEGEHILINAGLRKWVSLRQTAILHAGLLKKANNPTTFHVPLQGVLEWISVEDSGRLLERVCRENVPESFWNKCYNVGGGENFRLVNIEFERKILKALYCPSPEKIFEPNWFATKNFHGMWFKDSDDLNDILDYRIGETFEEALLRLKKQLPFYYKFASVVPSFILKAVMKKVALTPKWGTLDWIRNNNEEKIKAYWGSRKDYDKIGNWDEINIFFPDKKAD